MGIALAMDESNLQDDEARVAQLSDGQLEVLRMVGAHLSSKEIAARLDISPHTVDQRVRQALHILGVSRRAEAARLLAKVEEPYQRLIHQSSHVPDTPESSQSEAVAGTQTRHAGHAGRTDGVGSQTEQGSKRVRSSLPLPFATRDRPRNEMSAGTRLLWIALIAIGATFSAGMYLAGLESLSRLLGG